MEAKMTIKKLILIPLAAALFSSAATNAFASGYNKHPYQPVYTQQVQQVQPAYAQYSYAGQPINLFLVQPYYSSVDEIIPSYSLESSPPDATQAKDPRNPDNWEFY